MLYLFAANFCLYLAIYIFIDRYDHYHVVNLLVGYGGDINIKGADGLTPLHYAARYLKYHLFS